MAEIVKQINRLKTRQDFVPGVVVYGINRPGDLSYFIDRLFEINYKGASPEFLDLPKNVQDELDQSGLKLKQVPGRLMLPPNRGDLSPRVSELSARVVKPDTGLTGFNEELLDLGKVMTVELKGKARFFRESEKRMVPISSSAVDRRFTFFTLTNLPGVLEVVFGPLNLEGEARSVTAEEVAGAEEILAKRLATELARDASGKLKGLKLDAQSLRHPLPGSFGAGRSRSSRSRH